MHWAGSGGPCPPGKMRAAYPQTSAWRMAAGICPRGWPERDQCFGESLFRAQARLTRAQRPPWMKEAARHDSSPGGHPADEHLREALSRVALASSHGNTCPTIPVEGGVVPGLALFQYLRNVFMEPGDAHAAGNHQPFQADPPAPCRNAVARALLLSAPSKRIFRSCATNVSSPGGIFSCAAMPP